MLPKGRALLPGEARVICEGEGGFASFISTAAGKVEAAVRGVSWEFTLGLWEEASS